MALGRLVDLCDEPDPRGAVLYVGLNRTLTSSVEAQLQSASESARMELVEAGGISDLEREGFQTGLL